MILKEKQKIKVRMFFELMGWPSEALHPALKKIVDRLRQTWEIHSEDYSDPEKVGEKMHSSYVEIEATVSDIKELILVTLSFGPSVVEVLEPSEIILNANDLQDSLADMSGKVHELDKQVKVLAAQLKKANTVFEKLKNKPESEKEAQNKEPEESSKFTIEE